MGLCKNGCRWSDVKRMLEARRAIASMIRK